MPTGDGHIFSGRPDCSEQLALLAEHLSSILPCSLFIVDERHAIVLANERGQKLLSRAGGLSQTNGRLLAQRAGVDRALNEMIAATIQDLPLTARHLGIPDRLGVTRYLVRLHPLAVDGERLAVLLVVDLHARELPPPETLVRLFGFSYREAEFAAFFSAGLTLEQVSEAMQITPHTARIHLRRIFAKTGCAGQAQLARVLARLL